MVKPTTAQLQERILELEALNKKILAENGSQEVIDQLGAKVAELEATVAEQSVIIEELSKDNESKSVVTTENAIKVDGKLYKLISPKFIHKGQEITFQAVKSNPSLAQELVEIKMLIEA
jgi:uncharacterized coiled-coil protein SlyX